MVFKESVPSDVLVYSIKQKVPPWCAGLRGSVADSSDAKIQQLFEIFKNRVTKNADFSALFAEKSEKLHWCDHFSWIFDCRFNFYN